MLYALIVFWLNFDFKKQNEGGALIKPLRDCSGSAADDKPVIKILSRGLKKLVILGGLTGL